MESIQKQGRDVPANQHRTGTAPSQIFKAYVEKQIVPTLILISKIGQANNHHVAGLGRWTVRDRFNQIRKKTAEQN